MKKHTLSMNEIKLVGIKIRTNNILESSSSSGKIPSCVQQYFRQGIPEKILNRKNPSVTFCAYTDYESDLHGDYTFFIGEEVDSQSPIPTGLESLMVPIQTYTKFTTDSGSMPNVVITAWQKIWQMTETDFGGIRNYLTDFEIYDHRATDPQNTVLDIYIGINKAA